MISGSSLDLGLTIECWLLDFCHHFPDTLGHYPSPTGRCDFALDLGMILLENLTFLKNIASSDLIFKFQ